MKRISYFFVLFYLFTIVDRALFTSAQQEYTRRQFPPTETCEPLCLPLRTSVNTPSQARETNCFLLLTLASPWCASSSPPSPHSQRTRLWKYRANHLGKPSCSLGSTPSSPPQSAQYTVWCLFFIFSIILVTNQLFFSSQMRVSWWRHSGFSVRSGFIYKWNREVPNTYQMQK